MKAWTKQISSPLDSWAWKFKEWLWKYVSKVTFADGLTKVVNLASWSNSTDHWIKLILLINVKMPTFISRLNTTSESIKARNIRIYCFQHFNSYEKFNSCSVELSMKSFITSGPVSMWNLIHFSNEMRKTFDRISRIFELAICYIIVNNPYTAEYILT